MAETIVNFGTGVGTLKSRAFFLTPVDGTGAEAPFEAGTAVLNILTPGTVNGIIESVENNTIKVVFEKGDLGGLPASTTEIEVTADADQTSGIKTISQKFILNHVAAEAVGFGVKEGESTFEEEVPAV
jgi:hypothetical protein